MSRSLTTIYTEAVECRNKYLELSEIKNDSKMSIMDAFTWVASAVIFSFENIMDAFVVDIAESLNNRINGTPKYYANALLKYQSGDDIIVSEDGTGFGYSSDDPSKRIITNVAYQEGVSSEYGNNILILKIAKGSKDNLSQIDADELTKINAYMDQIKFAGTRIRVVSKSGDVLIPKVTVYYDGAVSKDEVYNNIEEALIDYISNLPFDSSIYASKVIDAIQKADHVTDVHINTDVTKKQGIFIAQYDDNNNLQPINVQRVVESNSGYLKQSTKTDAEVDLPNWRESIVLELDKKI